MRSWVSARRLYRLDPTTACALSGLPVDSLLQWTTQHMCQLAANRCVHEGSDSVYNPPMNTNHITGGSINNTNKPAGIGQ